MVKWSADETVINNPHQADFWTTGHILYFYYLMRQGWVWWAALLLIFFFEGIESLMGWNTPTDGLIVDPVQALMGIVTFLLFEKLGCAVVASRPPAYNAGLRAWLQYAASFWYIVFPASLSIFFHEYRGGELFTTHDWAFVPAFAASSLACAYMDRNKIEGTKKYIALGYAVTVAALVAGVNQIPYNPWFATLYLHTPIFVLYALFSLPPDRKGESGLVNIILPGTRG